MALDAVPCQSAGHDTHSAEDDMPRKETPQEPTEIEPMERAEFALNQGRERLSDSDLQRLTTAGFDAVSSQSESYAILANSTPVIRDKNALVAVPFISLEWRFHQGDTGEFVSATVMTQDNRTYILNDGGAGIYRQYQELTEKRGGQVGPVIHPEGLSVSVYWFQPETRETRKQKPDDGQEWRKATTYYLT